MLTYSRIKMNFYKSCCVHLMILQILGNNVAESIIFPKEEYISGERQLQQKAGQGENGGLPDYEIKYSECVPQNDLNDLLLESNLICKYTVTPASSQYEAKLTGVDANSECNSDIPSPPWISIGTGTDKGGGGDVGIALNIDRATLDVETGQSVSFCINTDLDEQGNKIFFHTTHVTLTFNLDGTFVVEGPLTIGPKDVAKYEYDKEYTVRAYQCDPDSNEHNEIFPGDDGHKIKNGEFLGVCVATVSDDTVINSLLELDVSQNAVVQQYIEERQIIAEGTVSWDCLLSKPNSELLGSMCFIRLALRNSFYENPDDALRVNGDTELVFASNRKLSHHDGADYDEHRSLQIFRRSISLQFVVSSGSMIVTGGVFLNMIALTAGFSVIAALT
mmetsp:Transcript_17704/g.20397  ORF Transcript_17704/g.20397 Transcript_17704/m.20397 type:complete len:390 (+) Transcript_17704:101-1270(+)